MKRGDVGAKWGDLSSWSARNPPSWPLFDRSFSHRPVGFANQNSNNYYSFVLSFNHFFVLSSACRSYFSMDGWMDRLIDWSNHFFPSTASSSSDHKSYSYVYYNSFSMRLLSLFFYREATHFSFIILLLLLLLLRLSSKHISQLCIYACIQTDKQTERHGFFSLSCLFNEERREDR